MTGAPFATCGSAVRFGVLQGRCLLYTYRRCPYAMRARMALLIGHRGFDAFEIVLRDKPAALLALSPKATVPVLHLADGRVIDESWEIMRWALSADDPQACWSHAQAAENLALLACNDGLFKQHLDRYKYPGRYPGTDADVHRAQAMDALLRPLEARLRHSRFIGGDNSACATDIAIFPFVRQFAAVAPDWFAAQPVPAVHAWLADWLASTLFAACMVKIPAQTVTSFPSLPR